MASSQIVKLTILATNIGVEEMAKFKSPPIQYESFAPPPTRQPVESLGAMPGPSFTLPTRSPGDPTEQDRLDQAWYAQVRALAAATRGGK